MILQEPSITIDADVRFELELETRQGQSEEAKKNTRANKIGSVRPYLRLRALDAEEEAGAQRDTGRSIDHSNDAEKEASPSPVRKKPRKRLRSAPKDTKPVSDAPATPALSPVSEVQPTPIASTEPRRTSRLQKSVSWARDLEVTRYFVKERDLLDIEREDEDEDTKPSNTGPPKTGPRKVYSFGSYIELSEEWTELDEAAYSRRMSVYGEESMRWPEKGPHSVQYKINSIQAGVPWLVAALAHINDDSLAIYLVMLFADQFFSYPSIYEKMRLRNALDSLLPDEAILATNDEELGFWFLVGLPRGRNLDIPGLRSTLEAIYSHFRSVGVRKVQEGYDPEEVARRTEQEEEGGGVRLPLPPGAQAMLSDLEEPNDDNGPGVNLPLPPGAEAMLYEMDQAGDDDADMDDVEAWEAEDDCVHEE